MKPFQSNSIAVSLRRRGFPVLAVTPIEIEQDGEVSVTDDVGVQVGETYLIVGKWVDERTAIQHWPTRTRMADIEADLRNALQD
tara:strand:+ start:3373 stop:3624 length:252 start_codon:yes stop_codon:yes gene_type:complete